MFLNHIIKYVFCFIALVVFIGAHIIHMKFLVFYCNFCLNLFFFNICCYFLQYILYSFCFLKVSFILSTVSVKKFCCFIKSSVLVRSSYTKYFKLLCFLLNSITSFLSFFKFLIVLLHYHFVNLF